MANTGNSFEGKYGFNIGIPNKASFIINAKNEKGMSPSPKMIVGKDLRSGN